MESVESRCFVCGSRGSAYLTIDDDHATIGVCAGCLAVAGLSPQDLRLEDAAKARHERIRQFLAPSGPVPETWPGWPACRMSTESFFDQRSVFCDPVTYREPLAWIAEWWPLPVSWQGIRPLVDHINESIAGANSSAELYRRTRNELLSEFRADSWPEENLRRLENEWSKDEAGHRVRDLMDPDAVRAMTRGVWSDFPDDSKVAVVVHRVTTCGSVWLFGLAQDATEPRWPGDWKFGPPITRVTAWPNGEVEVQGLARKMRGWYRDCVGNVRAPTGGVRKGAARRHPTRRRQHTGALARP